MARNWTKSKKNPLIKSQKMKSLTDSIFKKNLLAIIFSLQKVAQCTIDKRCMCSILDVNRMTKFVLFLKWLFLFWMNLAPADNHSSGLFCIPPGIRTVTESLHKTQIKKMFCTQLAQTNLNTPAKNHSGSAHIIVCFRTGWRELEVAELSAAFTASEHNMLL